jgi:hypothetical protein
MIVKGNHWLQNLVNEIKHLATHIIAKTGQTKYIDIVWYKIIARFFTEPLAFSSAKSRNVKFKSSGIMDNCSKRFG